MDIKYVILQRGDLEGDKAKLTCLPPFVDDSDCHCCFRDIGRLRLSQLGQSPD